MYKSKLLQYYHLNISTRKYIRAVSSSSHGVRMAPLISCQTEPYNITIIHRFTTEGFYANIVLYCIVFIHFYSASNNLSLSEALPTTAIDTVSEFTRRSATGNCR